MTAQKHLKERVRSRMQKTGEAYTTARRHVLSQRQDAVPGRATDPVARWHFPGNIPTTTALRILLTHAGVRNPADGEPFSEALLFVLAGGIGVGMFSFFYEKENFASFYVAGRHSWFDDLAYFRDSLERFGLKPIVQESSGSKSAEKQLHAVLAKSAPCVAWVDLASLPHRGAPESMQGGGYHVVTAYQVQDDRVLIGDLTDEPIAIPSEAFAAARARIKKQKNRLLSADQCTGKHNLEKLVRDGLAACADGLVEAKMGSMRTNFRLDALGAWADRLHGSKDAESWERIYAAPENLWRALTGMYEYIESYGSGGGLCRTIFADGLAEAADALGQGPLRALAKRYADLGAQWTALAEAALPNDVPIFTRARDLTTRRAELLHAGAPGDAIANVWSELGELQARAKAHFPLSDRAVTELRASLQKRVRALHDDEVAARQALLAALN
jgi:hypothetical protein